MALSRHGENTEVIIPEETPMVVADPAADADYAEHMAFYRSFLSKLRLSVGTMAVVLILLAYFLL